MLKYEMTHVLGNFVWTIFVVEGISMPFKGSELVNSLACVSIGAAPYLIDSAYANDEYYNKSINIEKGWFCILSFITIFDSMRKLCNSGSRVDSDWILADVSRATAALILFSAGEAMRSYMHPEVEASQDNIIDLTGVNLGIIE